MSDRIDRLNSFETELVRVCSGIRSYESDSLRTSSTLERTDAKHSSTGRIVRNLASNNLESCNASCYHHN